ncbi:MAG: zinc ribbon domain-containing protein [Methylovulum sp.]|nr:zinc ribbon domain-containing protein [Methylovulum sp.]
MPIYEYQCQSCGHEHEALQKLSAEPLMICPACSRPELMKKISAAGFRLKGGGWYETDFKSGAKKNVAGEASAPACSTSATACAGGSCKSA